MLWGLHLRDAGEHHMSWSQFQLVIYASVPCGEELLLRQWVCWLGLVPLNATSTILSTPTDSRTLNLALNTLILRPNPTPNPTPNTDPTFNFQHKP